MQNSFPGLVELQTVTVDVTNPNGYAVNRGVVAISDDGQTQYASVVNGVASATFAAGLLDFNILFDLFFSHPLTVSYGDSSGVFSPSSTVAVLPPILLDFFTFLIAEQYQQLTQYQVV